MAVSQELNRVDVIEAGIEAQVDLLSPSEQQDLGERLAGRFGWETVGSLVVPPSVEFTLVKDDYDLTVSALGDLGVKNTRKNQLIPSFEEVAAAFSPSTATYLGEHVERGDQPELTFHIPVAQRGAQSLAARISKFDEKQQYSTYIWDDLLGAYSSTDHNIARPKSGLTAGVLLNDTTKPKDREQPANEYNEAGLVHANHTVPEQRAAIEREQDAAKEAGVELNPANITEYLVTQAKRRQAGLPLLDRRTVTRFTQYPDKKIDGDSFVPVACVDDSGQLSLSGSVVGFAWGDSGVRRVVRVA
jgi:hypothetical protein